MKKLARHGGGLPLQRFNANEWMWPDLRSCLKSPGPSGIAQCFSARLPAWVCAARGRAVLARGFRILRREDEPPSRLWLPAGAGKANSYHFTVGRNDRYDWKFE